MDCQEVQEWLLQSEGPRTETAVSVEVARHLQECACCQEMAEKLTRLESAWRALPVPAAADRARQAFLERMPVRPAVRSFQPALPNRLHLMKRCAVAALVFLTVGVGTWLFLSHPELQAAPDLVGELIDWNLDLAQSESPQERSQLYASQIDDFQLATEKTRLPTEERRLADILLENGAHLSKDHDPLAEAERFSALADNLLEQMFTASKANDFDQVDRLADFYGRVEKQGVAEKLKKAEKAGPWDARRKQRLAAVAERRHRQSEKVNSLLQKFPPPMDEKIRQTIESADKKPKHHKHHKHHKQLNRKNTP